MVKVRQFEEKKKKMSELIERRRSSVNQHNLRRSKSVRESLRIIGTKFLHQRHEVTKSPSLSNITDEDNNYEKFFDENEVQTILKTPMDKPKKHYFHLDFLGKHKSDLHLDIPEMVAPKAAALLEIPIRENCCNANGTGTKKQYAHKKRISKFSESEIDKIDEEVDSLEDLKNDFSRGSFRLSMSVKRRNTMWSSFSSTSSTYLLL